MSRKKWRFAPTEVRRAISLVQEAGLPVREIEITADGAIRIHTDSGATTANAEEWAIHDDASAPARSSIP